MTQVAVPDSTLQNGGWLASPGIQSRHAVIDEGVDSHDSDTTYLYVDSDDASATAVGLESLDDPELHTDHVIRWVARETGATALKRFKIQLRRVTDNFLVHDTGWLTPGSSYAEGSSTLSEAEAANITDYGDLAFVFKVFSGLGNWPSDTIRITACQLEVPLPLRLTALGVEVLAKASPDLRLTAFGVEVLGSNAEPDLRMTAFGLEVLGVPVKIRMTAAGVEVLAQAGEPALNMTALGIEVLARAINELRLTQMGFEVLAEAGMPDLRVTAFGAEVLGQRNFPYMRLTQQGMEILGRARVSQVEPGPFPDLVAKLFLHNWDEPIRIETSWLTDITRAQTGAEERIAVRDRPIRALSVRYTGITLEEATELWANMRTWASARLLMPLYPDYAKLTAESSGTTLWCDASNRRFFPGIRVVVHYWERHRFPSTVEYGVIEHVHADRITLESALVATFPASARVYPVMECEPNLEQSGVALQSDRSDLRMKFLEVASNASLPGLVNPLTDVGTYQTYRGAPILPLKHEWDTEPTMHLRREGDRYASGRGFITELRGAPLVGWTLFFRGRCRAESFEILRFFDYAMGRVRTFWTVAPVDLFEPLAVDAAWVKVRKWSQEEQLEDLVKHIAVLERDGTLQIRAVSDIVADTHVGEDVWRIDFDENLTTVPTSLDAIQRVTFANLLRHDRDFITEEWYSTEQCDIFTHVIELEAEKSVAIPNLLLADPLAAAPQNVADLWFWGDPARHCYLRDEDRVINPATDGGGTRVDDWRDFRDAEKGRRLELKGPLSTFCLWHHPVGDRPALYWDDDGVRWETLDESPPFDNTSGFTAFVLVRKGSTSLGASNYFLERTDVFRWTHDGLEFYEDLGANDNGFSYASIVNGEATGAKMVLLLTWSPSAYLRVYKNGVFVDEAINQTTDLPTDALTTKIAALDDPVPISNGYWLGGVALYRRALTLSELNAIGTNYAKAWSAPDWTEIS